MKQALAFLSLIFVASIFFATTLHADANVDVIERTQSLDENFFSDCLDSLQPDEHNTLSCVAVKIPNDRVVHMDKGLMGSLNYIAKWSETHCKKSNALIYVKSSDNGDVLLVTRSKECLILMNEANAKIDYPFKNKSILLIKK